MQIVCPQCEATYEVADSSVGEVGRKVRCAACRTVWVATRAPVAELVGAEAPDGAAFDPPAAAPEPAPVRSEEPAEPTPPPAASDRVIDNAPPLSPADSPVAAADTEEAPLVRRAARLRRAAKKPSIRGLPSVILGLLAVITGILAWRAEVVQMLPQTASLFAKIGMPVNLRGLAIGEVKTSVGTQEGVPVLVITGTIANVAKQPLGVPRLRLALLNDAGGEVYSWTALPERNLLGPGEVQEFNIRLASPHADGRRVQVRFFGRNDAGR
jgi:predicted Zn finger-like uncharacterized protein